MRGDVGVLLSPLMFIHDQAGHCLTCFELLEVGIAVRLSSVSRMVIRAL